MRVLVRALVCLKGDKGATASEKRRALIADMVKKRTQTPDITLQLSTFIVRALMLERTLDPNVLDIIAELQNDLNFHDIVAVMISQRMESEIFTLALSNKLSDEIRN